MAGVAHAEPGGVSGVSSPKVTNGETRLEFRTARFDGGELDDSWKHRAIFSHAFTDWWRPTINLRGSQPADGSTELSSVGFESTFDFTATRNWPVHLGALVEYKLGVDGGDDEIDVKLLAEGDIGPVSIRFNINASGEIDDGIDWAPAHAARVMWRASDRFSLGLEAYREPDLDAHYVGPRATMRIGDATLALGYLAGVDGGRADSQFRLGVEFSP